MFSQGERIYLPGAAGEPTLLLPAVLGAPGVEITTSFVPGVNRLTPEMIGRESRVTGLFMQPALAPAQRDGRFRHLPMSYAATVKWLGAAAAFDCCIVQVTPPDADGRCSLGPAAEFTPEVLRRARRIVAIVNPNVPFLPHAPRLALDRCADVLESELALARYETGEVDPAARRIAELVVAAIPDGAALQLGLGKIPQAVAEALTARRGLRLHSGMLSDGLIGLVEAGALDPASPIVTTALLGSARLYDWARGRTDIHLHGAEVTHDPARLAAIRGFVAVNGALEVDLFGQCNLELAGGHAVSGAGGAPDFARAARLSPGGLSIVALPARFGAKGSRIRTVLGEDAIVSLPRTDIDLVVTEEGAADLRGLSVHERAAALIGVAAPEFRPALSEGWQTIAARL